MDELVTQEEFNDSLDLIAVWLFLNFKTDLFGAIEFVKNNCNVLFEVNKNYPLMEIAEGYKRLARTVLEPRSSDEKNEMVEMI